MPLGGAKQRLLLATLLLRRGAVVPAGELIDVLWGDDPPPSAAHSLEVYVSRLRSLFAPDELALVRSGTGYAIRLGHAWLDAVAFDRLASEAATARTDGELERAAAASSEALDLWRGPILPHGPTSPSNDADALQLEELRARTLELHVDAQLALGRHAEVIVPLRAAVRREPYGERLVAQLMLALHRSGRQADALAAYEELRRRLDVDLGLRPSAGLQQLSARIVRQEASLELPPVVPVAEHRRPLDHQPRRVALLVVSAAVAAVMALAASGSTPRPVTGMKVALVLPAQPVQSTFEESRANNRLTATLEGFDQAVERYALQAETLSVDEVAPDSTDIDRLMRRIDAGGFDLVLLPGDRGAAAPIASRVAQHPATRFVFLDASLGALRLEGVPNATAVRYRVEHTALLAGAATGLVLARGIVAPRKGAGGASVVASANDPETRRVISGFRRGLRATLPGARLRVDVTGQRDDPGPCERAADAQISAGSAVILVVAGRCGQGAAAVARSRGAVIVGEDEFGISESDSWVLGSMFKDWETGVREAVRAYVAGSLIAGGQLELGVDDAYAVGMVMSDVIPATTQSDIVTLCSRIRERARAEGA